MEVEAEYGWDREAGRWRSPGREAWGLATRQRMTPELLDRLCYCAAVAGSYEEGAMLARKMGLEADDSTMHRAALAAAERAREMERERVERACRPVGDAGVEAAEPLAAACEAPFSLVLMMDGWMGRERGPDWGALRPNESGVNEPNQDVSIVDQSPARSLWREIKTAIVFRLDHRGETAGGRPLLVDKGFVAHVGEPAELSRKLWAEAVRRGLRRAREVFVVADGGLWIWNQAADRFSEARGVLDFYHASGHLWSVAHAVFGEGTPEARAWAEPLLHQLRHGGEAGVIETLERLPDLLEELSAPSLATLEREARYFASHRDHLAYAELSALGVPIGSGAMESTCKQLQRRFKGPGQFWTPDGREALLHLELARRNGDWPQLWKPQMKQI